MKQSTKNKIKAGDVIHFVCPGDLISGTLYTKWIIGEDGYIGPNKIDPRVYFPKALHKSKHKALKYAQSIIDNETQWNISQETKDKLKGQLEIEELTKELKAPH